MTKAITTSFTGTASGETLTTKQGSLSISGTFAATIALRRSFDSGTTWHTVEEYTAVTEKAFDHGSAALTKLECTAFTSGTAVGVIAPNRESTLT